MYGTLPEFLNCPKIKKSRLEFHTDKDQSQQRINSTTLSKRKSRLVYQTADKEELMKGAARSRRKKYHGNQELINWAFHEQIPQNQQRSVHWVEKNPIKKNILTHKQSLLKAVAKTKEIESQDLSRSLFERSLDRIISSYSRIKTQPIISLLPNYKKEEAPQKLQRQNISNKRHHSVDIGREKVLELQKCSSWAKKRGKNFQSFYEQLGKSIDLAEKQSPGKSNYKLQQLENLKQAEKKRRVARKQFLKQINTRIRAFPNHLRMND